MKFEELDNKDIFYMKKAISIAEKGEVFVSPNPLVGCVIVKDKKISTIYGVLFSKKYKK